MLGIPNYKPEFFTSTTKFLSAHARQLYELVGKRITETWVVWHLHGNAWFQECPVILRFGDIQLEICAWKLDELAVTWNTIDLSQPLDWYGAGETMPLEWRQNTLESLMYSIGKPIDSIHILEYRFQMKVLQDKRDPSRVDQNVDHGWLLHGLEFKLDEGYLAISNGLDKNDVTGKAFEGDDIRKILVVDAFAI